MKKYCSILNEKTGLVQLGVGCPDEYYKEIGMEKREVEESEIDYNWYLKDKCPHYTDEEKLQIAKNNKAMESLNKAYDYEQNGTVEYKNCVFEMSLSNRQNLKDTVDALVAIGKTSTTWNDKDDKLVELTIEDIENIRLNLILGNIQKTWIEKYPAYLKLIDKAQTVKEVNNIIINY